MDGPHLPPQGLQPRARPPVPGRCPTDPALRAGGSPSLEVIDGDVAVDEELQPRPRTVSRRVDRAGRISILKQRYHVDRHLSGEAVTIESKDGLLHVTHHGVVVATHARRHLLDDDDKMDRRAKAARPEAPTKGGEVLRGVDPSGSVTFAGTAYRVGNRFIGHDAGVRLVGDTVQITIDGALIRTHGARHDRSKEFGALAQPRGKPEGVMIVSHNYRSHSGTRVPNPTEVHSFQLACVGERRCAHHVCGVPWLSVCVGH
ncbi:MAG: hypothetical protein ABR529_03475 [Actinomycetota bacterium]